MVTSADPKPLAIPTTDRLSGDGADYELAEETAGELHDRLTEATQERDALRSQLTEANDLLRRFHPNPDRLEWHGRLKWGEEYGGDLEDVQACMASEIDGWARQQWPKGCPAKPFLLEMPVSDAEGIPLFLERKTPCMYGVRPWNAELVGVENDWPRVKVSYRVSAK